MRQIQKHAAERRMHGFRSINVAGTDHAQKGRANRKSAEIGVWFIFE